MSGGQAELFDVSECALQQSDGQFVDSEVAEVGVDDEADGIGVGGERLELESAASVLQAVASAVFEPVDAELAD